MPAFVPAAARTMTLFETFAQQRHRVHVDAVASMLLCDRLGETEHRRLGAGVHRQPCLAGTTGLRHDVDDPAPATLAHAGQHGMTAVQHAPDVEREDLLPVVGLRLEKRRRHAALFAPLDRDASVVDQNVDRSERGHRAGDRAVDLRLVGDVGRRGVRGAAGALDLRHHPVRTLGEEVVDRDCGALFGELQRDAAAHALAGTGDEGHAAFQVEIQAIPLTVL